jgi:hypothetical protein
VAIPPDASAKLKKLKSKMKKNSTIQDIAAARAKGRAGAPGQLKKAIGAQSARQFTPAGAKNYPAVPSTTRPAATNLNPRMAPKVPQPGPTVNLGQQRAHQVQRTMAGNPAASAARKYGFDMNKVVEAAKRKNLGKGRGPKG